MCLSAWESLRKLTERATILGRTATRRGRPRREDQLMLGGMFYVLRTGIPWRDLPSEFGSWRSVYTRFRRWCANGVFGRMLAIASSKAKGELRHIDCSHIKLHQDGTNPRGGQASQAIGLTRGGLNTKLAAVVERGGHAVAVSLAAGQRHDLHAIDPLIPFLRRKRAVADKGFDADTFRARLCLQRTRICIPAKRGRRWAVAFHRAYYRYRHRVENFFCRIKRHRRISTRYEKLAETFLGFVQFAAVIDWLRA
jgi:transposase